ncbi:MAG TPA: DNA-directed RNA polymerase subunit omega [Thermoanaerobaculia bacterium]|nr:DNA-directed RNA polymerase subunit omega [Thermoanaerobaculia bacterium]
MDDHGKVDSKFRFVLVAAQRAEQLMRGARPKIDLGKAKPTRVAMHEIVQNAVEWNYGPAPEPEPQPAESETGEAVEEVH